LERKAFLFTILTLLAILAGGLVQILPLVFHEDAVDYAREPKPYTPLELIGRDVYLREGCVNCHTQMVRPLAAEVIRYGKTSEAWEFRFDHPFLWGSKRTGPDLHRVGGKYPHLWHWKHMMDPREISSGSIMPSYPHLADSTVDWSVLPGRVSGMRSLGVPYSSDDVSSSVRMAEVQARSIADNLQSQGTQAAWDSEMIALIAYLQRLGMENK
jgi:cytochrome c oxidase cbb3-type subunit I/II